jgi:hypothetical protein
MFNTFSMELIWPKRDTVTIEVPIKVPEYMLSDGTVSDHIPLEFIICKKRDMKAMFSTFPYLKNCVGPVPLKNFKPLNDSLVILAESEEAASHMVDSQVGDILSKMGDNNIQELHITD